MKDLLNRVSIPGRIMDLLWSDDSFYREVSSLKKASTSGRFPKSDQWCDADGFHMAFALAGYSPEDIRIEASGRELFVSGSGVRSELKEPEVLAEEADLDETSDDYPAKNPNLQIQQGMIVRGIARRSFKAKFFMSPAFDPAKARAVMKNGLLELIVPHSEPAHTTNIKITEK